MSSSETISPTAHYTGHVWARNGLSHPELETLEGRVLFESLRPVMMARSLVGQPTLEEYLVARHTTIDACLERAIDEHGVTQVIEVACGMSPRGWRFSRRYGDRLTYIEADLPGMAQRKRRALERIDGLSDTHRVIELDALRAEGPGSLAAAAADLDRGSGLAIITEGLLGYLPDDAVKDIWQRFAATLAGFEAGRYISDVHLEINQTPDVRLFRLLLSAFVRGRVHLHFKDPDEVVVAARQAGFAQAEVHPAGPLELARILEAST